jgi:hypothetical protein
MRQGWTIAELRGGVRGSGLVRTNGFAADIDKYGVLDARDRFGIRIAQPLRVMHGGIDIELPQDWDYWTQSVTTWSVARINLAPQGREVDYEMRYARPLWGGELSGNLFLRTDPGNQAAMPTDHGAAMRLTLGF